MFLYHKIQNLLKSHASGNKQHWFFNITELVEYIKNFFFKAKSKFKDYLNTL